MPKRKRNTTAISAPSKRAKETEAPVRHPHGEFDPDKEYKARCILDEKWGEYRIDWEDDEQTGEKFEPTWEPKTFANAELVKEWKEHQTEKKKPSISGAQQRHASSTSSRSALRLATPIDPTAATRTDRIRPPNLRKVIESSPPPEEQRPDNGHILQDGQTDERPIEIVESPQATFDDVEETAASSPLFVPTDSPSQAPSPQRLAATVQVSDPPSSFQAGAYEALSSSQILSGTQQPRQSSPEPSQYQPTPAETSKNTDETTEVSAVVTTTSQTARSVPVNPKEWTAKIVPDSQSLLDSSSFVPSATAETTEASDRVSETRRPPARLQDLIEPIEAFSGLDARQAEALLQRSQGPNPSTQPTAQSQPTEEREAPFTSPLARQTKTASPILEQPATELEGHFSLQAPPPARPTPAQVEPSIPTRAGLGGRGDASRSPGGETSNQSHVLDSSTESAAANADVLDPSLTDGSTHRQSTSVPDISAVADVDASSGPSLATDNREVSKLSLRPNQSNPGGGPSTPLPTDTQVRSAVLQSLPRPIELDSGDKSSAQHLTNTQGTSTASHSSTFPFQTQITPPTNTNLAASRTDFHNDSPHRQPAAYVAQPEQQFTDAHSTIVAPRDSSPIATSSPFPSVPSRWLGTLGESAPPRPVTPSSPTGPVNSPSTPSRPGTMESSQLSTGKSAMARRLAAMRAETRANYRSKSPASGSVQSQGQPPTAVPPRLTAETASPGAARLSSPAPDLRNGARSPSAVPAVEPEPHITLEEMNTSERYETLLPAAKESDHGMLRSNGLLTSAARPAKQPKPTKASAMTEAHVIPVSLLGHQRDMLPVLIAQNENLIQQFLWSSVHDSELTDHIARFVQRMRRVMLHPDLDNHETLTQYESNLSLQADWDVDCSAKFRFLRDLADELRSHAMHVAVLAQPGRLIDMLETFFAGLRIACKRTDGKDQDRVIEVDGTLTVTIIPSNDNLLGSGVQPADLVLCMDNSAEAESRNVTALRQCQGHRGVLSPLIALVVPHSIEHVERALSPSLSSHAKLRALVGGIYRFRKEAGKLEESQSPSKAAAMSVAQYLLSDELDLEWPLEPLSMLENLDSQTESEPEPNQASNHATFDGPPSVSVSKKRPRDHNIDVADADANSAKKARVVSEPSSNAGDIPVTVNPLNIEITHVSDSVARPTQINTSSAATILAPLTDTEKRLQDLLKAAQGRLQQHRDALSDLQYRHEEQRSEVVGLMRERDAAILTAQSAVTRMTGGATAASAIRAQNAELKQQVAEAHARLLDHSVPDRAELEQFRVTAAQAKLENERLEKRLASIRGDLEYAQNIYQTSSNAAQATAAQNIELENQLAVTKNRASGAQAKLRKLGYDAYTKNLQNENRKLKAVIMEREAALRLRDEEIAKLKEASRGRMGTRGTSVPRSPRLGSPMKMDGMHRGAGSRQGSRQGSPAARNVRGKSAHLHPLRNG